MLAILHLTIDLVTKITAIVPTASPARSALYSIPPIPTNPSWSLLEMMEATLLPPLRYSAAQKSFFNPFLPIKEIIRRDQRGTIRNLKGEIDYSMSFVLTSPYLDVSFKNSFRSSKSHPHLLMDIARCDMELSWLLHGQGIHQRFDRIQMNRFLDMN